MVLDPEPAGPGLTAANQGEGTRVCKRTLDPIYVFRILENQLMLHSSPAQRIDAYLDGPAQLRLVVADLTPPQLRARPVQGKWSILEVVCHLVDSEQAWCHRMKRVIAEERPLLIGYDESRFTATLPYQGGDLEEELILLEGMRRQMARILSGLSEAAWSRIAVHNERGLMTLEQMLQNEVEHVPHHITHIIEKRKALGLSDVGRRSR
jgi:uncharacterized damage-inducible protein DinB